MIFWSSLISFQELYQQYFHLMMLLYLLENCQHCYLFFSSFSTSLKIVDQDHWGCEACLYVSCQEHLMYLLECREYLLHQDFQLIFGEGWENLT